MIKIDRARIPFSKYEIHKIRNFSRPVNYDKWININKKIRFKFISAGHIPGSSSVLLEADGKRIFYTSDFNTIETQLTKPFSFDNGYEIDYVIIESTYANIDHPDREKTEKEFIERITEIIENDGIALIPAFAVARCQEMLCIFEKYGIFDLAPVSLDGMARIASRIFIEHPSFLNDLGRYLRAIRRTHFIK